MKYQVSKGIALMVCKVLTCIFLSSLLRTQFFSRYSTAQGFRSLAYTYLTIFAAEMAIGPTPAKTSPVFRGKDYLRLHQIIINKYKVTENSIFINNVKRKCQLV